MVENTVDLKTKDDVWFEILELEELGLTDEIPSKEPLSSEQERWEKKFSSFREEQEKSFADKEKKLDDDRRAEKDRLEKEISAYQQALEQYEKELLTFSFLHFQKKKCCKQNIEKTAVLLQNAKDDLSELGNKYKKKMASLEKKCQDDRNTLLPNLLESQQLPLSPYQKLAIQKYLHETWPQVLEKRKNCTENCTEYELFEMAYLELKCYILICLKVMRTAMPYTKISEVLNYAINKLSYYETLIALYIKKFKLPGTIWSYEDKLKEFLEFNMGLCLTQLRRKGLVELRKGNTWLK